MQGRFTGLTDAQWSLIENLLSKCPKKVGRPNPNSGNVLNTVLYVEITGCRRCNLPIGDLWGEAFYCHQWLGDLQWVKILKKIKDGILGIVGLASLID
jgi:hypothetical protein